MNKFFKKYIVVFSLMSLSSLSFAGLSVSPSVVNVSGVQGSSCKGSYAVTNKGDEPLNVTVNLLNGNSFSENKDINVEDWLKFEITEFNLKPEEKADIPFEVFVSSNMKGSVCGKVSFFSGNEDSMIEVSITVPVYIIVEGTEDINFEIESLNFIKNTRDESLLYNMIIKNSGNVHIRHSGTIQIFDSKKKKEIKNVHIGETVPTYCESSRDFSGNIGTLDEGTYVAVFTINALGKQATKEVKFKVTKDEVKEIKGFWDKWKNLFM